MSLYLAFLRVNNAAQGSLPNTGALKPSAIGGNCLTSWRWDEEVVPVLYVEDAGRAVAWYERLGFVKEWERQFEPGFPWFVSLARGRVRLYLSEHKGDARPNSLIHLYVRDVDRVAEEFGVLVDEEGLAGRETALVDPAGNRLRVATAAPDHANRGTFPNTGPGDPPRSEAV